MNMKDFFKPLISFHKSNYSTVDLIEDKWDLEEAQKNGTLNSWQQAELEVVSQMIDERGGFDSQE